MSQLHLSVVVPVYNEQDNLPALCEQIAAALDGVVEHEVVLVDDGSDDGTAERFDELADRFPRIRMVHHRRNAGQSAGLCTGVMAAGGEWIATLDGDLQNDPADIPLLLQARDDAGEGRWLIAGHRVERHDTWLRRISSRVANGVRRGLLNDDCPDTGCSLKLFRRDEFLLLPQFDHLHRFLPALFKRQGAGIINVPVNHRPRQAGVSKYGLGNRLWVGIVDLFGVRWLVKRGFRLTATERLEQRTEETEHE